MKKRIGILLFVLFIILLRVEAVSAEGAGTIRILKGSQEADSFRSGEFIRAVYERSSGYKKAVSLIAAMYDETGRLLRVEHVRDKYGNQSVLPLTLKMPEEPSSCKRLQVMLINSFYGLNPLLPSCEIYKSENTFYHPHYKVNVKESDIPALERAAGSVISMTDEQIKAVVPKQTAMAVVLHPKTMQKLHPAWDPFNPDVITDKNTGDVFPSAEFPNNYSETFTNLRGNAIQVLSYKDSSGKVYYFNAFVDHQKKIWLYKQVRYLSELYYLTGREDYARRVALILYEWSKYNPEYLNLNHNATEWIHSQKRGWDDNGNPLYGTKPYGHYEKRNDGRWMTEINDDLLRAYDLTYFSEAYEALGEDARKSMEDNLLANRADFVLLNSFDDPGGSLLRNNLINYVKGFASTGRVLERPDYMHYAYEFCHVMAEYMAFTRDPYWGEGTSYLDTVLTTFGDTYERMIGYSDPPGYISHITGLHISDAYAELERERLFLETVRNDSRRLLINPMGVSPFMHDTWSLSMTQQSGNFAPLHQSTSVLLDGFGEAVLGSGAEANQLQTRLHFSADRQLGHAHGDMLNLTLTAFGQYAIDDIGYSKSNYRTWTHYSLSHNTVVVDRKSYKALDKGNVTLYDDDETTPLIQVNDNGAQGRPKTFRRTVAQNGIDEEHPYVIDIFEVAGGGKIHDYVLHGARFTEQTVETDVPITKMEQERPLLEGNEVWKEPDRELAPIVADGYGVFTNVYEKQGVQNSFYVDFKYTNPYGPINGDADPPVYVADERVLNRWQTSGLTEPMAGLRAHFIVDEADENTALYIGDTPSLKLESLYPDEPPQARQSKSVIVRHRSAAEGLSSKFITVLEPYEYSRGIRQIQQLTAENGKNAVILKITMDGREDIVMIALDDGLGEIRFRDGNNTYATDGRYAVIHQNSEGVNYHLYGGSMIFVNGACVYSLSDNTLSGRVLSVTSGRYGESTVKVSGFIPEQAAGRYVFLNFAKKIGIDPMKHSSLTTELRENVGFVYRIDRVVQNGGGISTLYLAEESGILETAGKNRQKNYTEIFYNWRVFSNEVYYTIY